MTLLIQDTPDDTTLGAYIEAAAPILGVAIAADWRQDVLDHFRAITAAARLVQASALDDAVEAAPVFQA